MSTPVCPRCREEVSLPHGASPRATVECPLCLERYPLGEAMRTMAPLLAVIDDPDAGLTAVAEPSAGYRLAEEASSPESAAPAFDFRESAAPSVKRASVSPVARPRRPAKNPLVEIVKLVGGGLVGIALAILIVWWIIGKDPFELGPKVGGLPVLKHLVPQDFRGEPIADTDDETEAGDQTGRADSRKPTTIPRTPSRIGGIGGGPRRSDDRREDVEPKPEAAPSEPEPPSPDDGGAKPVDASADPATQAPGPDPNSRNEFLGVREAPQFSADEFDGALLAANQARAEWLTAGAAESGPAEASAASERKMYEQLARLAHITTFLPPQDFQNRDRETRLRQSLIEAAGKSDQRQVIARLGAEWLDRPEVRKGSGIAVVGVVKSISVEGKLFVTRIDRTDTPDSPLVVLSKLDPEERIHEGQQVLVLGSIVKQPAKRLAGYQGQANEVVWGGYPIPLSGN